MNKKYIFLVLIIILILTLPNKLPIGPKVNPDDFIFEPDSLTVASLFSFLDTPEKIDEPIADKCECKSGKVSYDGGSSLTDCPCKINGSKCACKDCPYNKLGASGAIQTSLNEEIYIDPIEDKLFKDSILGEFYILKATAPWCVACKVWSNTHEQEFKDYGIEVREKNIDFDKNFLEQSKIQSIPHFLVCTKIDNLWHSDSMSNPYGFNGSAFTIEEAKNLILTADKSIHPSRNDGIFYIRQQTKETPLNGKLWATKREYIQHLRENPAHNKHVKNWDLNKLSRYELKAIHDDDHANQLDKVNHLN